MAVRRYQRPEEKATADPAAMRPLGRRGPIRANVAVLQPRSQHRIVTLFDLSRFYLPSVAASSPPDFGFSN